MKRKINTYHNIDEPGFPDYVENPNMNVENQADDEETEEMAKKHPIDEYDDFIAHLDDPISEEEEATGELNPGDEIIPEGNRTPEESIQEPAENAGPTIAEPAVEENKPVEQAPATQASAEEEPAMAEEPMEEEVLEEGGVEEAPAPPPNPSLIPAFSPVRMQQFGGLASSGLAKVGDYLEGDSPAPRSSTLEANGDDLSDLFEGPQDTDLDVQIDDLVDVDETDVFGDGGEDMSDLTDVPEDLFDVSGVSGYDNRKTGPNSTRRVVRGSGTPAGMSGMY